MLLRPLGLWLGCGLLMVLLNSAAYAGAQVVTPAFENDQQQQLYYELIAELRCLVCQNQNLADSNADLAKDLRRRLHELIGQGQSRAQILDYMAARYGEFILYRPRLRATTWLLWFAPFVLLVGCLLLVFRRGFGRGSKNDYHKHDLKRAKELLQPEDSV